MSPLQLLRAMLDGQQAPAELRALALSGDSQGRAAAGDSANGPADLSWFALPNGAEEIARLAARALAAAAEEGPRSALDRLRTEVSHKPASDPAKPRATRRLRRWAGIGLAGVAATGAIWVATRDDEGQWRAAGADLLASAAALVTSSPGPAEVTALASAAEPKTPQVAEARPARSSPRPALRVSQAGEPYLHADNEGPTPTGGNDTTGGRWARSGPADGSGERVRTGGRQRRLFCVGSVRGAAHARVSATPIVANRGRPACAVDHRTDRGPLGPGRARASRPGASADGVRIACWSRRPRPGSSSPRCATASR